MKKIKKIILSVAAVLLAAVLCWCGAIFMYYPQYRVQKRQITASEQSANEIRVMSCNLRCISPTDLGKKSWFYRADLIVKNIEKENSGINQVALPLSL